MTFWTKYAQKGYFWPKTEKVNITVEFCISKLVYTSSFTLNWQFLHFGPNLPKKGISDWKRKNWTTPLSSAYSNKCRYQISAWTGNFDFLDQIWPRRTFLIEILKSEYQYWILLIQVSLDIKLQLKLTILTFWTKFGQKGYFRSKSEKLNITIEFCVFELV